MFSTRTDLSWSSTRIHNHWIILSCLRQSDTPGGYKPCESFTIVPTSQCPHDISTSTCPPPLSSPYISPELFESHWIYPPVSVFWVAKTMKKKIKQSLEMPPSENSLLTMTRRKKNVATGIFIGLLRSACTVITTFSFRFFVYEFFHLKAIGFSVFLLSLVFSS